MAAMLPALIVGPGIEFAVESDATEPFGTTAPSADSA